MIDKWCAWCGDPNWNNMTIHCETCKRRLCSYGLLRPTGGR